MGKFQKSKEKKHSEKNKQAKKYLRLTVTGILVALLAVMPMLASRNAEGEASQASILSATVEEKTINTQIIGGGQLSSEASLNVRIPENVKLTQYLVGNGDTVKEGDAIARVDKISVMTAITKVQETLDYLAEEIADASDDTASTSVNALAGGTVKVIYATEGESVQDVMLDHGALAVLSLDDTMAVKIEKETTLDVGDTVIVTLADGTQVDGRVKTNLEGVLTITLEDDDYSVGAKVTVATESGDELGVGELYIFSPWNAMAYSGIVDDILITENASVYVGQSLFSLEDTGNSPQFQRLIDQRQEYEELMQELFTMYRTETITAPCDGIITGVDEDGAYLLSDSGNGWFASLLSFFGTEKNGFMAYTAVVTEVTGIGMKLQIDPQVTYIEDLAAVSGGSADPMAMTEIWEYTGDITVYTQDEKGLLRSAGTAQVGDLLLAVGDEEAFRWFVVMEETEDAKQTGSYGLWSLSSDSGEGGDGGDGGDGGNDIEGGQAGNGEDGGNDIEGSEGGNGEDGGNSDEGGEGGDDGDGGNDNEGGDGGNGDEGGEGEDSGDETPVEVIYMVTYIDQTNRCVTLQPYGSSGDSVIYSALTYADGETLIQVGDKVKLVNGVIQKISGSSDANSGAGGMPSGGAPSGGGMSGSGGMSMGGVSQTQTFELYSLDKLTVASVTSQEHMTVSITIDELDITKIYVGQAATVSVDALGGEQFDAEITQISNSGENEGGNSKFTVEVTLGKSGDMLPGMYSSAFITLETSENVPCVPVAALGKDGVDSILYTSYDADSGTLCDPVVVTIGVSDGENVQVLEGLTAGETCYYEYYDTYVGSDAPQQQGGDFNLGAMMGRR